jgi:hypothetical protein
MFGVVWHTTDDVVWVDWDAASTAGVDDGPAVQVAGHVFCTTRTRAMTATTKAATAMSR